MSDPRKIKIFQISRGMAPAASIAHVVDAAHRYRMGYEQVNGRPAAEAKQIAAKKAFEEGADLILCEDDIIAPESAWGAVANRNVPQDEVSICTALMRNGVLNTWFTGTRVAYSGTVWLYAPWPVLDILSRNSEPWFQPRNLLFDDAKGAFEDHGHNPDGLHSDVWFYHRCWQCDVRVRVLGSVTHLIHEYNNVRPTLTTPSVINPLGIVTCQKLEGKANA